ncbi:hypothetical protein [Pseudomonas nunensis]|uniref:Uncharacterized protein n=1 Tax=Pseudomonas nunensis TaxID=2961896 RepID=A0ABY5EAM9_9PSED|nr:hypothetical protein [Pseudomonas nunensis]KPN91600.1 hypothetical protein AL066_15135 [Pseudomonas nunensis]MCL5229708.1 hypothetical protein [Pseudomonas nunensis]UTO11805.1 hypothetical protein NK667_16555 [Pseudomonas nunensis]
MKTLSTLALLASVVSSAIASAATFDGYECTEDCSGHQAGYDWAEQNDIDDEDSCDTPSQSFNEGCQSFVEGGSGIASSDDDDDEED